MTYEPLPTNESSNLPSSVKALEGQAVFVRTVTFYYTGRIRKVTEDGFIILTEAAWVPSTNRWANVLVKGGEELREVEPYPDDLPVLINMAGVIEILPWRFDLPREQK